MKIIIQSYRNLLRYMAVLFLGVAVLASCGEVSGKTDLLKIAKVFYDTGWTPEKQKNMQVRLQNAKNETDVKQALSEMIDAIEPTSAKLDALDLQTPEAKSVRDKLSLGLRGVVESTRAFMNVDTQSASGIEQTLQLQGKLIESQKTLQEGLQELKNLAAAQGVDLEKIQKEQ